MTIIKYLLFVCAIFFFQVLFAKDADQRSCTFEKSLNLGEEFKRRTRLLVLRAAVLRNQIHVKVIFPPILV